MNKPPLGLIPCWVRDMERFEEIIAAMERYSKAELPIPIEWIEEADALYYRAVQSKLIK